MLNINPSSVISVVNIFFHLVGFFLLMVSFAVQKLLTLTVSHWFIFTCISFTLRVRSKKYDHITQSNIQIQYNPYQNPNGIFHRSRIILKSVWTGRPGVLQFMGVQRVGHNWVTELNKRPRIPKVTLRKKKRLETSLFLISKYILSSLFQIILQRNNNQNSHSN